MALKIFHAYDTNIYIYIGFTECFAEYLYACASQYKHLRFVHFAYLQINKGKYKKQVKRM